MLDLNIDILKRERNIFLSNLSIFFFEEKINKINLRETCLSPRIIGFKRGNPRNLKVQAWKRK